MLWRMIPKNTKICISTQHPGMGGGIGRIVDNFSDYLIKKKYDFKLMYSNNPLPNIIFNESVKDKLKHPDLTKKALMTRTYLPFFNAHYPLYGRMMKKKTSQFNVCHQIGGNCLEATPFLYAKRKYICWTATTFLDEWKTVYKPEDKTRLLSWAIRKTNNHFLNSIRKLEKKVYENASIINPISQRTADMIKKEFGIDDSKIRIIPPPSDFSDFKKIKIKKKIDFNYILFVGRLDKRKDLGTLFRAFALVKNKFRDLKLVILGDGPEKQSLIELSKKLEIARDVVFVGFVDDKTKIEYLSQAKIFCLSSTQEGFGIVLVESLALGVPVISTDCGGPADIVEHGRSGYLTKIGDYKTFADKIIELIYDETLRKQFGNYGKTDVMNKFSIENIGKTVIKEYEEVYQ